MSVQYTINGYIKAVHYKGDQNINAQVYCKAGKIGDVSLPLSKDDNAKCFNVTIQVKVIIDVYDGYFGQTYSAYIAIPFLGGLIKIKADERQIFKVSIAIEDKLIRNTIKTFYD